MHVLDASDVLMVHEGKQRIAYNQCLQWRNAAQRPVISQVVKFPQMIRPSLFHWPPHIYQICTHIWLRQYSFAIAHIYIHAICHARLISTVLRSTRGRDTTTTSTVYRDAYYAFICRGPVLSILRFNRVSN